MSTRLPDPRHATQRFFAPEVIQTSAMDCGPAALKCLLEGFGIPVSYGRRREACQTDVDGTSIDTIEDVATTGIMERKSKTQPKSNAMLKRGISYQRSFS